MRGWIVPELHDQREPLQHRLNNPALHAAPAAVHDADFDKARLDGRGDVLLDNGRNIRRRERMQIDLALDRDGTQDSPFGIYKAIPDRDIIQAFEL